MIEAAIEHSPRLETIEDVEAKVATWDYQIWFGRNSCIVTEVAVYPSLKAVNIVHGGGDMQEMLNEMEPAICVWAKAIGCSAVMGIGRKGWERAAKNHGYSFAWITMMKRLDN
jgi:hypothetical protein